MSNQCKHEYEFSHFGCTYICADGKSSVMFDFWRCVKCGNVDKHPNKDWINSHGKYMPPIGVAITNLQSWMFRDDSMGLPSEFLNFSNSDLIKILSEVRDELDEYKDGKEMNTDRCLRLHLIGAISGGILSMRHKESLKENK